MQHDDKPLTEAEIKQGWHFCVEADGLLVGPGMAEARECECFPQNAKLAHPEQEITDDTKVHHLSTSDATLRDYEWKSGGEGPDGDWRPQTDGTHIEFEVYTKLIEGDISSK